MEKKETYLYVLLLPHMDKEYNLSYKVKFGYTENFESRLKTGYEAYYGNEGYQVLHVYKGDFTKERDEFAIRQYLKEYSIHGNEWFKCCQEVLGFFKTYDTPEKLKQKISEIPVMRKSEIKYHKVNYMLLDYLIQTYYNDLQDILEVQNKRTELETILREYTERNQYNYLKEELEFDLDAFNSYQENRLSNNLDDYIRKKVEEFNGIKTVRDRLRFMVDYSKIATKENLENLLMTRPLTGYRVLGFDPAFRTGCKLACLDEKGNVLHKDVIYPHEPKNDKIGAAKKLLELISTYNLNLIAIGNGTASRESEEFVAETIKNLKGVYYIIVSEAGASVYSASKEAQREFPDYEVQERSAVSIGRRVIDPLSELVKIDPKSIGVGEYQHDVNTKKLTESLDYTVSKVVNNVGVNINTSSSFILKYISGLTKPIIDKIIKFKEKNDFKDRTEIKKLANDKVYEQAIGFLRINNGTNPLDNTGIHPESYELTNQILKDLNLDIKDINTDKFKETLENVDINTLINKYHDEYTIKDIIKELKNPGLDPRTEAPAPILRNDVLTIDDLKVGMQLKGTVRNVASFGAFVDIGLHNDGLLHISKMSTSFVKDPNDIVNVGDIITVYVDEIFKDKEKVTLSLIKK